MEKSIGTKRIGDGKTPNHYWVSISSNYYYYSESNYQDWISDLKLFKDEGKTIAVFDTFKAAKNYVENKIYLGMVFDGIRINNINIEDRISGEIYSSAYVFSPETATIETFTSDDTHFTETELQKRGIKFS